MEEEQYAGGGYAAVVEENRPGSEVGVILIVFLLCSLPSVL